MQTVEGIRDIKTFRNAKRAHCRGGGRRRCPEHFDCAQGKLIEGAMAGMLVLRREERERLQ